MEGEAESFSNRFAMRKITPELQAKQRTRPLALPSWPCRCIAVPLYFGSIFSISGMTKGANPCKAADGAISN
jgi:hypothetical protein